MDRMARESAAEGRQHEADDMRRIDRYLATQTPLTADEIAARKADLDARNAEIDAWLSLPETRAMLARRMVA
jgi:hypothetical protein